MTEINPQSADAGPLSLPRRDRLERIANAERDRRAGLTELAEAAIGEPIEWPARVVLALCKLSARDANTTTTSGENIRRMDADEVDSARLLLEEGLNLWANEAGLGSLDPVAPAETADRMDGPAITEPIAAAFEVEEEDSYQDGPHDEDLAAPFDGDELEQAFATARTEVESMHSVNEVAERVLRDEPLGLADLASESLTPVDEEDLDELSAMHTLGMDAAVGEPSANWMDPAETFESVDSRPSAASNNDRDLDAGIIATLEGWLENLQRSQARRAQ